MISELRRVPPSTAAWIVLGAALLTIALMTAVDALVGSEPDPAAPPPAKPSVVRLDPPPGATTERKAPPAVDTERPEPRPEVPIRLLVGSRLAARMDGANPSAGLLRRARRGEIGGVIVFPGGAGEASLSAGIERLQASARAGGREPLIVAIDQEGGIVKRLPGAPPAQSARQMGGGSADQAERAGADTARALAGAGVNTDFAPVLDVAAGPGAFIGTRSFGTDPSTVASRGTAFAIGLQSEGVAATAKHFPGLGSATANTDLRPSVVDAPAATLRSQLEPFQRAIDAGIRLVMVGSAIYPAYEAGVPAVMSKAVVGDLLRGELGFDGVVVSDDLEAPAISSTRSPGQAAVSAARAGTDILLFAKSEAASAQAFEALSAAARSGELDRGQLEESYDRIEALRADLGS